MSVILSVCPSVRQHRLEGNVIFSAPNWDIAPIFFVQIPLINEHLFCEYFVRLSVGNAIKGFATYGSFHPCLSDNFIVLLFYLMQMLKNYYIFATRGHQCAYFLNIFCFGKNVLDYIIAFIFIHWIKIRIKHLGGVLCTRFSFKFFFY